MASREAWSGEEVPLPRGDVTEGVVRVGDTVRRPRGAHSDAVAGYLRHLEAVGFDGAPRWLGVDERGRDILDYLPGEVPGAVVEPWVARDTVLEDLGRLVRRLHDASAGYEPQRESVWFGEDIVVELPAELAAPLYEPELVSHCDITPQNTVFRRGVPYAIIDFDLTRPTTRLFDVMNTAMHWVPLKHPDDRDDVYANIDAGARLRRLVDAYELSHAERLQLVDLGIRAAQRSWHRMHANAVQRGGGWARMWAEGVGDVILRREQWLRVEQTRLTTAMTE